MNSTMEKLHEEIVSVVCNGYGLTPEQIASVDVLNMIVHVTAAPIKSPSADPQCAMITLIYDPPYRPEWRKIGNGDYHDRFQCPYCEEVVELAFHKRNCEYSFCPFCGERIGEKAVNPGADGSVRG